MGGLVGLSAPSFISVESFELYLLRLFSLTINEQDVLDGGMVTIAIFTYNFFHPGCLLPSPKDQVVNQERENKSFDA